MAELLSRGYNVAMPEVDVGDDIFVVRDRDGELSRVQVKAAIAKELPDGAWGAVFKLSLRQLRRPHLPEMNYVLTVRRQDAWRDFIVIERKVLNDLHDTHALGKVIESSALLSFTFSEGDVVCKEQSFKACRNDWSRWPVIDHRAQLGSLPPDEPPDVD
jgi:hypothetical protein